MVSFNFNNTIFVENLADDILPYTAAVRRVAVVRHHH